MFLDQLNARLVKKQEPKSALDTLSIAVENYATISNHILKSGIKGMHKGMHKDALANLHKRADVETGNSQRLMAGNYPTGYHSSQSSTHEDLAAAFRSHGLENPAEYHDKLAVAHDKRAGGDGSGLAQNKVAKEEQKDTVSIWKGLGKGSGRGRPKGSKNGVRQTGPNAIKPATPSEPKPNINNEAGGGHSAADVKEAFDVSGKHGGGHHFTPNVMMHKDKDQAQIHSGAMHGHLQDSGFEAKKVHNENGIMSTEYEHPNGTKVLLNEGASGGRNFVGYHHDTTATRAADFGGKPKATAQAADPAKEAPTAPAASNPKALPAAAKSNPSAVGSDGTVDAAKFKKGLKKIAGLTDWNDHNMALYHGAKLIGRDDIAEKAKAISKQHLKQGHMSGDLISQRGQLHNQLAEHAKKVLSPDQAHALHMSY